MFDTNLHGIQKPGRYVGNEINAYRKSFEKASIRFALAFPDVYEVGLSHLGLQLLYHSLNQRDDVLADRVYAPWLDFEHGLRSSGESLRGIESRRPLRDFDFIGFSLQYELSYTNILTILDLAGIPFEAKDRGLEYPFIIAGGPCAFNPEPLADFFDFLVLGEAEEVLPELIDRYREWHAHKGSKEEFLQEVSKIRGIYVPSFFHVSYHTDGTIASLDPLHPHYTIVEKRLVKDLDHHSPIPEEPLVPLLEIVHNRLGIEIARGCTRGCRFCQAGFIYRPVRERNPELLLNSAERALANSGFEEMSLLSLSTGDYCQIQPLLVALMDRLAHQKIAVSFPSMRVGTLTSELMELILRVRKTGFTLAPEAGSERLRRVINKGILDEDLLVAAESAFKLGWRLLKLYFMMGLPTETDHDLDALVDLCLRVWERGKLTRSSINVSVSTFVPKPHTPFQWASQIPREQVVERLSELKERLRKPGMKLKWQDPSHSLLEGVFARGDRRLGRVLRRAWELGARFDAWTEVFREETWRHAFRDAEIDPAFFAERPRSPDEVLPWDHLSSGVHKTFLWAEYQHALGEEATPDCRWDGCTNCGVCDHKTVQPQVHRDPFLTASPIERVSQLESQKQILYWFRYAKLDKARFLGQLEMAHIFERTLRRARLPLAFTEGFHPHVKLSFLGALPLGMESLVEEACLTLTDEIQPESVLAALNAHLPEGLSIEEMARVPKRPIFCQERRITYLLYQLSPWRVRSLLQNWLRRLDEPLTKKTKKGEARSRLGDVLLDLRLKDPNSLEMDLFEGTQLCFRPLGILQHLSGESLETFGDCRIRKTAAAPWAGARRESRAVLKPESLSYTL